MKIALWPGHSPSFGSPTGRPRAGPNTGADAHATPAPEMTQKPRLEAPKMILPATVTSGTRRLPRPAGPGRGRGVTAESPPGLCRRPAQGAPYDIPRWHWQAACQWPATGGAHLDSESTWSSSWKRRAAVRHWHHECSQQPALSCNGMLVRPRSRLCC